MNERGIGSLLTRYDGTRNDILHAIEYLGVEHSQRYLADKNVTFCNLYVSDLCDVLGAYLPRVWWNDDNHTEEVASNAIFSWLESYGSAFAWSRVPSLDDVRAALSRGAIAIVCARSRQASTHGHIAAFALDADGGLILSHAGHRNFAAAPTTPWWDDRKYDEYAFWTNFSSRTELGPRLSFAQRLIFRFLRIESVAGDIAIAVKQQSPQIPPLPVFLLDALCYAEDRRFAKHRGFDVRAILRAIFSTLRGARQGGSTIEQQLVRTITNRRERTLSRKFTEIVLAHWLSSQINKRLAASVYMWVAYYGWRMNGLRQALLRQGYNLGDLTQEQASILVAALRYPFPKLDRDHIKAQRDRRARTVLSELMKYHGPQHVDGSLGTIA